MRSISCPHCTRELLCFPPSIWFHFAVCPEAQLAGSLHCSALNDVSRVVISLHLFIFPLCCRLNVRSHMRRKSFSELCSTSIDVHQSRFDGRAKTPVYFLLLPALARRKILNITFSSTRVLYFRKTHFQPYVSRCR